MATAPKTPAPTPAPTPGPSDSLPSSLTDSRPPRRPDRSAPQPLTAVVVPGGGDDAAVEADVIDLGKGGVKLVVPEELSLGESILLRLLDEDRQVVLGIRGTVCWSRPIASRRWRVGCRFEVELPVEQIGTLASGGYLERRQHPRYPLALSAMAQWELENEPFPVELEDVSAGGFCLFGTQGNVPGQRLRLILGAGSQERTVIVATIRWQVKVEDGYLIGCEFSDQQGYSEIMRFADTLPDGSPLAVAKLPTDEAPGSLATTCAPAQPGKEDRRPPLAAIRNAYRRLVVASLGIVVAFAALWVSASDPPNYWLACLAMGVAGVSSWQFLAAASARACPAGANPGKKDILK